MDLKKYDFKLWVKAASMRALKTAAQVTIASIGSATMFGSVDWAMVGSTVLLSVVASFITSVAGLPEVPFPEENEA